MVLNQDVNRRWRQLRAHRQFRPASSRAELANRQSAAQSTLVSGAPAGAHRDQSGARQPRSKSRAVLFSVAPAENLERPFLRASSSPARSECERRRVARFSGRVTHDPPSSGFACSAAFPGHAARHFFCDHQERSAKVRIMRAKRHGLSSGFG